MGCVSTGKQKINPKSIINKESLLALPQENLVCGVCALQFDMDDHYPVMICINQHNLCKACVVKFSQLTNPACPYCRQSIDSASVKKNRILMEILTQKNKKVQSASNIQSPFQVTLKEARSLNLQKIIFLLESGMDLKTIKDLHLWDKKIPKIINLNAFSQLKSLDMHKNNIKEIKNLQSLTGLTYLNLGKNSIQIISGLKTLKKLQFLDLCHNRIFKIQNICELSALMTLNLSSNYITIVENLHQLKQLSILYLNFNLINPESNSGALRALQHRGVQYQISSSRKN